MGSGIGGLLRIGRIGAASQPDIGEIKIHVLGTKGGLVVSDARPEVSVYYRDQPPTEQKNQRIANESDFLLMDNFVNALDTNSDILNENGQCITAVAQACLELSKLEKKEDVLWTH